MNPVVHFEMPYKDRDRLVSFYNKALGWQMQTTSPEMGDYVLATTTEVDEATQRPARPGAINGGFFPLRSDSPMQVPSVVIGVPDIHEAMKAIAAAGGKVLGEPIDIPGVGMYVSFEDTEGNRASLLQTPGQA